MCCTRRRYYADPRRHNALDRHFHPRQRLIMLRNNEEDPPPHATAPPRRRFLVLIDKRTLAVQVLNPFTRRLAELPSLATLLCHRKKPKKSYARDLNGGLSVTCAGLTGQRTLALLLLSDILAVARTSDAH
jgi:hypothetical protein